MIDEEKTCDMDMEAQREMAADRAASVTAVRIAQNLLNHGADLTMITECTGLSSDDIRALSR